MTANHNLALISGARVKLIACDLDGTLLTPKNNILADLQSLIIKLKQQAILFVPATGRDINICPWFYQRLSVRYLISNNGSLLNQYNDQHDQYEVVTKFCFPFELTKNFLQFASARKWLAGCVVNQQQFLLANASFPHDYHLLSMVIMKADQLLPLSALNSNMEIYRWVVWVRVDRLPLVLKQIKNFTHCRVYTHRSIEDPDFFLIDVNPALSDKWTMVKAICQRENIPLQQVMSIGNGNNDFDMIKYAGIGACPLYAPKFLLQVANVHFKWKSSRGLIALLKAVLASTMV